MSYIHQSNAHLIICLHCAQSCGLRHPVECVDVFLAPILDVVHPFPTWSFSLVLSIHDSEHCILQESVVIHPDGMSKEV